MATSPLQPGAMTADPMANPDTAGAPDAQAMDQGDDGSYTICLDVAPSGQISVRVEGDTDDAAPGQGGAPGPEGEAAEPAAQTYPNIKAALTAVLGIYRGEGQQQDDTAMKGEFQGGFDKPMGR